jgi:hypothetical protein
VAFSFAINELKGGFFDAAAVLKEMDKVQKKTLSRFGAYARRRMKSSLKYKSGKSSPGGPPNVHRTRGYNKVKRDRKTGATSKQPVSPLRELIYFAYDAATGSVVVGPVKFGGSGGKAPGLLERGGSGSFRDAATGEIKRGVWAPRPFVRPAGEAEVASGKFLTG